MRRYRWRTAAALTLATGLAVSIAGAWGAGTPASGSLRPAALSSASVDPNAILRVQATAGPNLDPIDDTYTCELQNLRVIYDSLFNEGSDGTFQPSLATAYKLLPGNVLQLTLRSGVNFQDGTPFNGNAVAFNLNRALHNPASTIATTLAGLKSIIVVNPTTVDLNMTGPDASSLLVALSSRAGMMASPTAIKKDGTEANFAVHPVGTGPYEFLAMQPRQYLYVRKWTGYWNPAGQTLGGINFVEIPFTSLVNAIRANNVDWVSPQSVGDANSLKSDTNVRVLEGPGDIYNQLILNPTKKPFTSLKVRQAISYAINREALAEALTGGVAHASYQDFAPGTPAYVASLNTNPLYPYNPAKARKLLKEAGYPDGFTFTAIVGSSATLYVNQGELIAAQLAKVGITMNVKLVDISTAFTQIYVSGPHDNGTVASASYGGEITPDPLLEFQESFLSSGTINPGHYQAPGVAKLVAEASVTLNGKLRASLLQQANVLVTKYVADGVPLFFLPNINAIANYVHGVPAAEDYCNQFFNGVTITKH